MDYSKRCGTVGAVVSALISMGGFSESAYGAVEAVIEVRECAGIAREHEPVVLAATDLVALWGPGIDVASLRLAREDGALVPLQVDERDGGLAFLAAPNGKLDPDDEVVWQASIAALGTQRFRLFTTDGAAAGANPGPSELSVGTNTQPRVYSAALVMRNVSMDVGVCGWPADPKQWGGACAGCITLFRLYGHDEIAQGEGHQFVLNNGNIFDRLYGRLEAVAAGPVRALLQITGDRFDGRVDGHWGSSFYDVDNGRAVRTYALYDRVPWLEVSETIRADRFLPRFTALTRFHWRPGGRPFDAQSVMYLPNAEGGLDAFRYADETYGATRAGLAEPWVFTARPGELGTPVLFFDPQRTWRVSAHIVEPWMKKGFDEAGQFDRVKCVTDVTFFDPDAAANRQASWRYAVWGTRGQDPREVQAMYRAWMLRPLRATARVLPAAGGPKGAALADALRPPEDAPALLREASARHQQVEAQLEAFAEVASGAPATVTAAREITLREGKRTEKLLTAFTQRWETLDPKARYEALRDEGAWRRRLPAPELAAQQFELFCAGSRGYAVLVSDNCSKVFRTLRCPGALNAPVSMSVGRREGESVQLAIVPIGVPLKDVRLSVGDLAGEAGALPATCWKLYQVGDVAPPAGINPAYGKPENARWPDPLLPLTAFDCPADEARAVLLTLYVPADTPAGTYQGAIRVAPGQAPETAIPIEVRVANVLLPERRTLLWDCWYDLDTIARHYGEYADLDAYTRNMAMLSEYRAVPGLYGWAFMGAKFLSAWRETDGTLTFDFSAMDRWLEVGQRWGNLWNPNLSCNSGWFAIFHHRAMNGIVKDRVSGKVLTLDELPQRSAIDPEYTLVYEQFMQAYVRHLKEKGWLDTAWLEKWDEPVRERIEPCKRHYAYLRRLTPELKLFNWGMRPVTDDWGWGYTQAWAPNVGAWYAEWAGIERARAEGVKVFAYTCGAGYPAPDRAIMRPDIAIWDANIQRRVLAWFYEHFGYDGMLTFMMNGWPKQSPEWSRDPEKRWPRSDWRIEGDNTAWLVYPGPDGAMYPSLRLDALRDGFEDYELVQMAKARLKTAPDGDVARALETGTLIASIEVYEQDRQKLEQRKQVLLKFLE